ncbi:hypothetical protein LVJ83_01975 [Uruburuella testudinis]|uniref:Uncharacterized protein n=1 Tax=Uruburuella testudinis TaxID=1282863 RepID=A0ABY4DW48_9NEIS|nr:hypothetical protein [Uruburuella testudinis]UOO82269.1 hypothetical protein LVJ83_01975 [Uruburuella testudinis]
MRGFLFLEMQMQGKKHSKIGPLARLFNAADAFSGVKSTRKSNGQDTLECPDHSYIINFFALKARLLRFQEQKAPVNRMVRTP